MPGEWVDFLLATEFYHCTPSELDAQDDRTIEIHTGFVGVRKEQQHLEGKRAQQRSKQKKR